MAFTEVVDPTEKEFWKNYYQTATELKEYLARNNIPVTIKTEGLEVDRDVVKVTNPIVIFSYPVSGDVNDHVLTRVEVESAICQSNFYGFVDLTDDEDDETFKKRFQHLHLDDCTRNVIFEFNPKRVFNPDYKGHVAKQVREIRQVLKELQEEWTAQDEEKKILVEALEALDKGGEKEKEKIP